LRCSRIKPSGTGVDLSQPLSLVLLEMDGQSAGYAARRLRNLNRVPNALVDEIDGILLVLCSAARAADVRKSVSLWARRELGAVHRGVLSRPVSAPGEIPSLYATLRRSLAVLGRIGVRNQIVSQNELALYSTLFETHDQASLADFTNATIGPLIQHDRKRSSSSRSPCFATSTASRTPKPRPRFWQSTSTR
jgi:hypothetical protein